MERQSREMKKRVLNETNVKVGEKTNKQVGKEMKMHWQSDDKKTDMKSQESGERNGGD